MDVGIGRSALQLEILDQARKELVDQGATATICHLEILRV
jgi:hypothetical protein